MIFLKLTFQVQPTDLKLHFLSGAAHWPQLHQSCNTVNCGDRLVQASKRNRIFPRLYTL